MVNQGQSVLRTTNPRRNRNHFHIMPRELGKSKKSPGLKFNWKDFFFISVEQNSKKWVPSLKVWKCCKLCKSGENQFFQIYFSAFNQGRHFMFNLNVNDIFSGGLLPVRTSLGEPVVPTCAWAHPPWRYHVLYNCRVFDDTHIFLMLRAHSHFQFQANWCYSMWHSPLVICHLLYLYIHFYYYCL